MADQAVTTQEISGAEWSVRKGLDGTTYENTYQGVSVVVWFKSRREFSYVIVVDNETSPRYVYDNKAFSEWNVAGLWAVLYNAVSGQYSVLDDVVEEAYDDMYACGAEQD